MIFDESKIYRIAGRIVADNAATEIHKFLKQYIKHTPFRNKVFVVGGFLRDQYLKELGRGVDPKDIDLTIEQKGGAKKFVNYLANQFPGKISVVEKMAEIDVWGAAFKDDITYRGVTYNTKGGDLEIAQTQAETYPDPASRQRQVEFALKEQDIERRDFTTKN
jgi:tRNA nucleotidyltransferase/poly(A) polymerase